MKCAAELAELPAKGEQARSLHLWATGAKSLRFWREKPRRGRPEGESSMSLRNGRSLICAAVAGATRAEVSSPVLKFVVCANELTLRPYQPLSRKLLVVMICAPAAGRPAFRMGVWDRNGREHCEDGADDHIPHKPNSESVRGERVGTVSEWRSPGERPRRIQRRSRDSRENL
jgi:hypothetical protein